jgi:bifunctional non-homologous end joining protein LigD
MSLVEYRRKRDFAKTPEPAGGGRAGRPNAAHRRFVVQRHAARRLHYDFRLELDGVLKSWAVPKGPSLDPEERRLAVHVEDHPLDYAGFEGVIPAGEYGGGTVMVWDSGTWEPEGDPHEGYAKGHLRFRLHGGRLHGSWSLVRTGGGGRRRGAADSDGEAAEDWLLIKHSDEAAEPGSGDAVLRRHPDSVLSGCGMAAIAAAPDRRVWTAREPSVAAVDLAALRGAKPAPLPDTLPPPQLATAADAAPGGDDWLYELKWDGYRLIAAVARDRSVRFASRNGLDWSERFPEIAAALAGLRIGDAVLDGELVRFRQEDGLPSFSALKTELSEGRTDRLVYVVFDLLHLDGHDLRDVAIEDRKTALEAILSAAAGDSRLRYSEHLAGQGTSFAAHACALGVEGIIAKRRGSHYRSGARSKDWLKIKCVRREEFAVVGWTPPGDGGDTGIRSLLLGYHDPAGRLHYAGGVGSGFSGAERTALRRRFDAMPRGARPPGKDAARLAPRGARWVEPQAVAEIRFADWTGDGLLRHATYLGLREDKEARDVVLERRSGDDGADDDGAPRAAAAAPAATDARRSRSRLRKGEIEVAEVVISNAEKLLFPDAGITKGDLARFQASIANRILPHLAGRPLSLVRAPDGIGGQVWFQKHERAGTPDAIRRIPVQDEDGGATQTFLGVDDVRGLVSLVQMGVIEIHPWGSRLPNLERPDRLVFDLDPDETVGWERVVQAALQLRDALAGIGFESFAKTTGGKGLHLVVPITPACVGWDDAKAFARDVAVAFEAAAPARFTSLLTKRARRGRIFIDYLRNGRGATAVAPYSPRARAGATVATPVSWQELEAGLDPADFTVATLPSWLAAQTRDPWARFEKAAAAAGRALAGK